jgi:hypothetical protein
MSAPSVAAATASSPSGSFFASFAGSIDPIIRFLPLTNMRLFLVIWLLPIRLITCAGTIIIAPSAPQRRFFFVPLLVPPQLQQVLSALPDQEEDQNHGCEQN